MNVIKLLVSTIAVLAAACLTSCQKEQKQKDDSMNLNPFFSEYNTSYQVPPLDIIKESHYREAFEEGMKRHEEEIKKIAQNSASPTFENTIEALETSGELLTKVSNVFFNLTGAHTNDSLRAIEKEISPLLTAHNDNMYLNADLFQRINVVVRKKEHLTPEQLRLLDKYYKDFIRKGANLNDIDKERLKEINKELASLSVKFEENILNQTNAFQLWLEKEDLKGLPQGVIDAAAGAAKEAGKADKWLITLHKPSFIPFLQYSEKRDLRKKVLMAYANLGNSPEHDNKETLKKTLNLRLERAKLLGFESHAEYVLDKNMAKTPENVIAMMDKVWKPALEVAKKEAQQLQKMIDAEGKNFQLEPWDWWYYAEKVKQKEYNLDENELRPYFKLENVIEGVFFTAEKLFNIKFERKYDVPLYHPEVKAYSVLDSDRKVIGIYYVDYFPRSSKRSGAWMNSFRKQSRVGGKEVIPIIVNVCNFTKPTANAPSLLSLEEVSTLFHEFGHAIHGLVSDCTYPSLSGTSVPRDYVEYPSQVMENWCTEPEVLKSFAKHYETGELIPDELIQKIKKASLFNQGFTTVEYMSAAYLDMTWHTLKEPFEGDVMAFEEKALSDIGLIPEIIVRYRTPYFRHIFASGYSAGYYGYIWSEVLDADTYAYFKETSIFDPEKSEALKKYIFSSGNKENPMDLYRKFRGKDPDINALLAKRGLL